MSSFYDYSPCLCLIISYFRLIQSLRSEAAKSEDMFIQLQETQESVRLAFLNCFLDFAGMMDDLNLMFVSLLLKDVLLWYFLQH